MTVSPQIVERRTHILRTCGPDMTSHEGFRWPESGHVAAPDWRANGKCGGGLHGFLEGEGDGAMADWNPDAKWIVARVERHIDLRGKVKAPEAWVEYVGTRREATDYLQSLGYDGAIIGCTKVGGDGSSLVGGAHSALTGGDHSTLTAGFGSTLRGGDHSTLTGGDRSTLTGGDCSTLTFVRWDGRRRRLVTIYPGEDGIEAGQPYRLNGDGRPVRAEAA